jgi:H+/gluconate symporter-like permease
VILSCAAMTYGGVSLFVVAFAVWPIASALFREADLPKVLIPATIALGAFTFTMTALPGTPAIQNAIPMPYFGTTPFAAPGLGLITGALMLGLGWAWLECRARRWGRAMARTAAEGRSDRRSALPPRGGGAAGAGAGAEPCLHLRADPGDGHGLSGAAGIRRNRCRVRCAASGRSSPR